MQRERGTGRITPRGAVVQKVEQRRPVRPRVVQAECQWLRQVCRWAVDNWKDPRGEPILARRPGRRLCDSRGWGASAAGHHAGTLGGGTRGGGGRDDGGPDWCGPARATSYLPEILDLMHLTGHRISAILQLRWEDIRFEVDGTPLGVIRWPGETDKTDWEHSVPMNSAIRQVIDRVRRQRPGIGPTCPFPKPTNRQTPISKERVRTWLLRAETLAGVPKQDGSLFHAYRRGWATARKHLSLKDVAAAGGWKRVETLMRHYIQARHGHHVPGAR